VSQPNDAAKEEWCGHSISARASLCKANADSRCYGADAHPARDCNATYSANPRQASINPSRVVKLQQRHQACGGAIPARVGDGLAGCADRARPWLSVSRIAGRNLLQAAAQGDGGGRFVRGGEGGFQRLGQFGRQAGDGLAERGGQIRVAGFGHAGILGRNGGATGKGGRRCVASKTGSW